MGLFKSGRARYVLGLGLAALLAACQGNLGTGGSGLSIPQAPGLGQPGGPGGPTSQSRQQVLEGAVYMTPSTTEVPLPTLDGFSVTVALGTPPPSPVPGESAAPGPTHRAPAAVSASARPGGGTRVALASSAPQESPSPSAAPSSGASAAPRSSPSPGPHASAAPAPKIDTKTIVFPDDAPEAPTPVPTGNVQTFVKRGAIVRGYVMPSSDITLYGLAAIRFTIPSTEQLPQRGFTIAVFQSGKKHREKLLDSDTSPTLASDVVASDRSDTPLVLKKNTGYLLMLYGDEAPATPAPVQAGYPTPGNNPFPMPSTYATGPPGYPGQPTYPPGPGSPYATPTPFH